MESLCRALGSNQITEVTSSSLNWEDSSEPHNGHFFFQLNVSQCSVKIPAHAVKSNQEFSVSVNESLKTEIAECFPDMYTAF